MNRNPEYLHQELLIIRFRKGDTSVFEEIITYWEPQLLYYIRRLVISEEDARMYFRRFGIKSFVIAVA